MKIGFCLCVSLLTLVAASCPCQGAITVYWDASALSTVNGTGSIAFDEATLTFSGFTADKLTLIDGGAANPNGATFRDQWTPGGTNVKMDIRLDGNWTTIFSTQTLGDNAPHLISAISTPIAFASGTVDALRWTSSPNTVQTFYNWATIQDEAQLPQFFQAVNFTFDATASAVPEPASLIVWSLLGLTITGGSWWRRRKISA